MAHSPLKKVVVAKNTAVPAATMGELPTNLRQLTRCFSLVGDLTIDSGEGLALDPAYFGWDNDTVYNGRFWRIARLYAYFRGSVRWKVLPKPAAANPQKIFFMLSDMITAGTPTAPGSVAVAAATEVGYPQFINIAQTPIAEVQTAFYSRHFLGVVTSTDAIDRQSISIQPVPIAAEDQNIYLFTAAGDDFSFGFLKAPPLLTVY